MKPGDIVPTIGRQVWYWQHGADPAFEQPEAATVCYVHDDRKVNLQVIDHHGHPRAMPDVKLRQPGDEKPRGDFCEWMPFQKGQAAKQELRPGAKCGGCGSPLADIPADKFNCTFCGVSIYDKPETTVPA